MSLPSTRIPAFCGSPVSQEELALITEMVTDFGLPRSEIANTVCELLDWQRPSGKLKTVECLDYLERLEALGCFVLPAPKNRNAAKKRTTRRTEKGAGAKEIACSLKSLRPVSLIRVESRSQRDLWNELIDRHHYLGYRVPFGASLRYLITSAGGDILGCMQWSSPARSVAARDTWIGWDPAIRKKNLQRLVQNSRFLILPWVQVKGLASHVLGKAARQVAGDWSTTYGKVPVLFETFVDQSRFQGTCYRAANWECLGHTKGRGRMDKSHLAQEPVKSVWVYPLRKCWRREIGMVAQS
jgi:hypothetical protein